MLNKRRCTSTCSGRAIHFMLAIRKQCAYRQRSWCNMNKIKQKLQNGEKALIVGFGDSLTQGWMTRKGYLDFLDEMLKGKYPRCNYTILNRGTPGDTSDAGLYRIMRDVVDEDPDLVLVQFALNDAYLGVSRGAFINYMRQIINSIKNNTFAEMLVLTSVYLLNPRENIVAEDFYAALEDLCREEELGIVKVHEHWKNAVHAGVEHHELVQGDGVHPTVKGYRLMAEAVFEFF